MELWADAEHGPRCIRWDLPCLNPAKPGLIGDGGACVLTRDLCVLTRGSCASTGDACVLTRGPCASTGGACVLTRGLCASTGGACVLTGDADDCVSTGDRSPVLVVLTGGHWGALTKAERSSSTRGRLTGRCSSSSSEAMFYHLLALTSTHHFIHRSNILDA